MSRHKIHYLSHGIKIQEYNNGSYAYWIEDRSYWKNIPAELGKVLVKELKPNKRLTGKLRDLLLELIIPVPYSYEPGTIISHDKMNLWMLHEMDENDLISVTIIDRKDAQEDK